MIAMIAAPVRELLRVVVLVGGPAILLWSITALARQRQVEDLPLLFGAKRILKARLAQHDMSADEYERVRLLIRSLPLRAKVRARFGISLLRTYWIVCCVFSALVLAALVPSIPIALILAPLTVMAAFIPVGRSKPKTSDAR